MSAIKSFSAQRGEQFGDSPLSLVVRSRRSQGVKRLLNSALTRCEGKDLRQLGIDDLEVAGIENAAEESEEPTRVLCTASMKFLYDPASADDAFRYPNRVI